MRTTWALLVVLCIAVIAASVARPRGMTLHYGLSLPPPAGPEAPCDVHLTVDGAPRESLVLFVAADRTAFPIEGVRVADDRGRPIDVVRADRTVDVNREKKISQPRFVLQGPLPARLHVRYRTTVGVRQGNEHVGFNHQCFGLVLPDAVVFSGRSVFLVPQTRAPPHRVVVSFTTPPGWEALTPWKRQGDAWVAGIRGGDALDHLVSATVGLGAFSVRRFRDAGTEWSLAAPRAVPPAEAERALGTVERATRYIVTVFRRGLGPRYLAFILPKSSRGDEVPGEGWGTGQGGTLIPATRTRIRTYAEQLVDAFVLHAPYRSTLEDRRDYWFPSGVRRYYGTMSLGEVGLMPRDEIAPALAVRLMTAPGSDQGPLRFERDFDAPGRQVPGGEPAAAALLYDMDRTIRRATGGKRSLDDAVAQVFQGRRAASPWTVLPRVAPADWKHYRDYYVVQGHFAPLETFPGLTLLALTPSPDPGPATRRVRLICTGSSGSFLENCGCKASQSGGVARRGTMLRRLRGEGIPSIYLDAGNAFPPPGPFQPDDRFSREETKLALAIMKSQGVAASAVSTHELTWGLEFYRAIEGAAPLPYVSMIEDSAGERLAAPSRILSVGGIRVAVLSAFEPPAYIDGEGVYENHAREFRIPDPLRVIPPAVREARAHADLVAVLGRMPPAFVRRLVAACPEIDLVLSNETYALVSGKDAHGRDILYERDQPGFIGHTLVVYTDQAQYGMTVADLGVTKEGKVASAAITSRVLDERVPDDPSVRARLSAFYRSVGRAMGADAAVAGPFAGDTLRMNGLYAGVEACRSCHEEEYMQWRRTAHAGAYKTLLDAHRNYQPRCVGCHVVAYGAPHGYQFGDPSPRLVSVQCEVCHGPGAAHARDPDVAHAVRGDNPEVCLSCHTPDHSDAFVFEERLPMVLHHGPPVVAQGGSAGKDARRPAAGGR